MTACLIGLGSNLGQRDGILDLAVEQLAKFISVESVSQWYSYPAVGPQADGSSDQTDQPEYLNGVVLANSPLSASKTAQVLHDVEATAGRERVIRWSSRTLDADLLLFGDQEIHSPKLTVPHPRMVSRQFVLEPAAEIAPEMVHPQTGWTIRKLWHHLREKPPHFAVVGADRSRGLALARMLAETFQGTLILDDFNGQEDPAGMAPEQLLECVRAKMAVLGDASLGPWFANFWTGQLPTLAQVQTVDKEPRRELDGWLPKYVLVHDEPDSEFARSLREMEPHVPMIFLSANPMNAEQDAIGAVQGLVG